ncbi:MAG: MerR family transcriptional regulator [Bacillaceae bacterium]
MKEYYKISEISSLYNICTDSLRYYEKKGILTPRRDKNGYRLYGLRDIWKLNVIKELRQLDFSTERIKTYLDERTVDTTLRLLMEEDNLIEEKIQELRALQKNIRQRTADMNKSLRLQCGKIAIRSFEDRRCCRIQENVSLESEIDFLIKKLQKSSENSLHIIGNSRIGACIDESYWKKGIYHQFSSVFIIDEQSPWFDDVIKGGIYLTISYRGDYSQTAQYLEQLVAFSNENGYTIIGEPLELYKIDIHETSLREEFVTEIQLPVVKD